MKQTAVEWLIEQMLKEGFFDGNKPLSYTTLDHIQQQAKAMEREQIEDAYYDGQSLNAKSVTSQMIIDNSISYYNETYKGGDK